MKEDGGWKVNEICTVIKKQFKVEHEKPLRDLIHLFSRDVTFII